MKKLSLLILAAVLVAVASCNKVAPDQVEDGDVLVDLGLSVKWAVCNLGASNPEEYGDYFAWGEITPYYAEGEAQKSDLVIWRAGKAVGYDWRSYSFCQGDCNTLVKYNQTNNYGILDNKLYLESCDDAAYVASNGKLRMPTPAEWEELSDESNCKWEWTQLNGVYGFKISGRKKGYTDKWIFLPAAGKREGAGLEKVDEQGHYWSSWLDVSESSDLARIFFFYEGGHYTYFRQRFMGNSIRPVAD